MEKAAGRKFPLFVDISGQKCVIIGGGTVALRRTEVLLSFGARVIVISPQVADKISGAEYVHRPYRRGDCQGAVLAVAATDNRAVNHNVYEECSEMGIPVSVADSVEECSFFFPAVCLGEKITVGIVSDGTDHSLTAKTAAQIRHVLEDT